MDPSKLAAIKDWPILGNLHDLQSFIGLCSYYRRFIVEFFLQIAGHLHDLTKKNIKYVWGSIQEQAIVDDSKRSL